MSSAPPRYPAALPSTEAVRYAAGYIRVSDPKKQADNHSPEVQRTAIIQLAAQLGVMVTLWEQDLERGRVTTRPGYQRILEACRQGQIQVILVFSTSRWGRRSWERILRGEELDRLGVDLWSVQQGHDKPGIQRVVFAGVDEEASRQLAANVRPARQNGARSGTHMGPTPLGYRRVYPAWDGKGKRPPADMLVDEASAWIVRELFARYATGDWSCGQLATWMTTDPHVPRPQRGSEWGTDNVRAILRNVTYAGLVGYDRRPQGYYERARPGESFTAPGRHEALVDVALWQHVQELLTLRGKRPTRARVRHQYLAAGLLRCAGCGGPMRPHVPSQVKGHKGSYLCQGRCHGSSTCTEPGYRMDLAHEALLAELRRLRGSPWTVQAEQRLSGDTKAATEASRLRRALDQERAALKKQAKALTMLGADLTPEAVAAFRAVSEEASTRIAALESQLAALDTAPARLPDLRHLHGFVQGHDLAGFIDRLDLADDEDRPHLRAIALACIDSAQVVERTPANRSRWLRMEVVWSDTVHKLLAAGLLWLEPSEAPPAPRENLDPETRAALDGLSRAVQACAQRVVEKRAQRDAQRKE